MQPLGLVAPFSPLDGFRDSKRGRKDGDGGLPYPIGILDGPSGGDRRDRVREESERVCVIDRVTLTKPVEIQPSREPDRVFLRGRTWLSPPPGDQGRTNATCDSLLLQPNRASGDRIERMRTDVLAVRRPNQRPSRDAEEARHPAREARPEIG